MHDKLWQRCCAELEGGLPSQQFNAWIRPLQAVEAPGELRLLAPNRYVRDTILERYCSDIERLLKRFAPDGTPRLSVDIGSNVAAAPQVTSAPSSTPRPGYTSRLNPEFTFESFVEGKSNQVGRAAAVQVAQHPGTSYNPLLIYGGTGLGKTHLMHAIGNLMLELNPGSTVSYLHSERYVADMVKALQHNTINEF